MRLHLWRVLAPACCALFVCSSNSVAEEKTASTHNIGAAKLIIGDVKENQTFWKKVFNMTETNHFSSPNAYDEPIMSFDSGARLALFHPLVEQPLAKSQFPVALIYTPDLEAVVQRLDDGKYRYQRLPAAQSGTFKIVIARDPSGNAIEILSREGKPYEVGGSKLIVDDRQKAEDFYARIFSAKPGQRYQTPTYDEVLMNVGDGAFLALFQPKNEAPLPKSQYPVVAIYTSEFDAVLKRVTEVGLGYREVKSTQLNSRIIVAKDPAGNSVEIISR
jgi:catechol-2,3-dioxygenase